MTRVAKPAPKVPESGTQFVAKPLMLKKSEIEKQKQRQKRKAQEEEDRKRTQTNYGQDSANAPKRHRSENAKNKRNEKRREFRKIEKEKNFTCFLCRQKGHSVKNCPKASEAQVGVCYRCGSDEHTTKDCSTRGKSFAFATCFVCGGQGHLASKCEKNDKGLYPDGGGC
ncbi:Zinc finger CCHC domain-containing protein 9, partial [Coemansia asiatica]